MTSFTESFNFSLVSAPIHIRKSPKWRIWRVEIKSKLFGVYIFCFSGDLHVFFFRQDFHRSACECKNGLLIQFQMNEFSTKVGFRPFLYIKCAVHINMRTRVLIFKTSYLYPCLDGVSVENSSLTACDEI